MTTLGRLPDAAAFSRVIVKSEPGTKGDASQPGRPGRIVRLADVARVELGAKNADMTSSLEGAESVTIAVFQLPAVFVPTAFITGISGQFYRQFALTIAASSAISAFVSLTLAPAVCAILCDGRLVPQVARAGW